MSSGMPLGALAAGAGDTHPDEAAALALDDLARLTAQILVGLDPPLDVAADPVDPAVERGVGVLACRLPGRVRGEPAEPGLEVAAVEVVIGAPHRLEVGLAHLSPATPVSAASRRPSALSARSSLTFSSSACRTCSQRSAASRSRRESRERARSASAGARSLASTASGVCSARQTRSRKAQPW